MNQNQIEQITGAAQSIIGSLQNAIFSTMQAASQGVESQVKMASAFQRLEAQEAILDWLMERRIAQEEKLEQTDLRPAQKALIQHKISQIDEHLTALLKSSGVDGATATKAVGVVVEKPRIPKGKNGAGRFVKRNGN